MDPHHQPHHQAHHGGGNAAANGAPSRYDDLLRQVVQLNTDLQKTAALSQTLQRERDGLQHNNSKARLGEPSSTTCLRARSFVFILVCVCFVWRVFGEQLKDEVKRLHERCDKLQLVLMQETEQKVDGMLTAIFLEPLQCNSEIAI